MIARFRVALPFPLSIRAAESLAPYDASFLGIAARVYPPYQCSLTADDLSALSSTPAVGLTDRLEPVSRRKVLTQFEIEGQEAVQLNALQIDFLAAQFERRRVEGGSVFSPDERVLFTAANDVIARLRTATRAPLFRGAASRVSWPCSDTNEEE